MEPSYNNKIQLVAEAICDNLEGTDSTVFIDLAREILDVLEIKEDSNGA
jgi:hypothetical protein